MSTVADLLGMPEVLARAKPMKLKLTDGTEIEGTFMEQAKGLDIQNLSEQARQVDAESLEDTDGKGFRSHRQFTGPGLSLRKRGPPRRQSDLSV